MTDYAQTVKEIEEEIRKTPYHKGTEHHIGKLRARLARLKDKILETEVKKGGGGGGGYAIRKTGDATVVLVGPPSVGKSTLINKLTNTESKVAPYEFTTTTVIPGMLKYQDAYIQILDLPGLIEGAGKGKGRGKEVLSVTRNADLILIMCDAVNRNRLTEIKKELAEVGIRINQKKPDITIDQKPTGGLNIHSNLKQNLTAETFKAVAGEMGITNADINLKQKITLDELIDSFSANRVYLPSLTVYNKADLLAPGQKKNPEACYISATQGTGLDELKQKIWEKLKLVRIYLVHPDEEPSLNNPIVMKQGNILADVAQKIGEEFASDIKSAKIWGPGARFPGQEVSLSTKVLEGMQVRFL